MAPEQIFCLKSRDVESSNRRLPRSSHHRTGYPDQWSSDLLKSIVLSPADPQWFDSSKGIHEERNPSPASELHSETMVDPEIQPAPSRKPTMRESSFQEVIRGRDAGCSSGHPDCFQDPGSPLTYLFIVPQCISSPIQTLSGSVRE